ncbi:response regulator [Gemmata sp. JC673]|uniref:Response regulator n=1 Tax=Gemmata algarum TaxID=2975278 RepID=A0ABU5EVW1_9BACT|nr:response regulator [Gemmata algarum]MDY3559315.1 response regulator [Gemmata algarum]
MLPVPRPAEGEPTKTEPPKAEYAPCETRFSILIADDDRGTREALAEMLDRRGFRTVLAADGSQAVELVQVDLVHLVLFDMHMPRLTGLEAFAVIRQTLDRLLPAVLMTADATNDLIRQAFAAQVYSVIPKPVNGNVVLHTLERALVKVYGPRPEPKEKPEDKASAPPPGTAP